MYKKIQKKVGAGLQLIEPLHTELDLVALQLAEFLVQQLGRVLVVDYDEISVRLKQANQDLQFVVKDVRVTKHENS